jgi:two-component system, LytTR family, sensor kinase
MKTDRKNRPEFPESIYRSRLRQFALLVIVCLTVGLIDGFRSYVGTHHDGLFHGYFYGIMRWDVSGWLIWVAFIPLVLWLCKRFPLNRNSWQKALLLFIPVGFLLALVRTFFPALVHISLFEGLADLQSWLPNKFYILLSDFVIGYSFFLLILSFGQAKNYYKRMREEELRATKLEAQLTKAELQALKMQLHPHFLFNVLNSIAALQTENPEAAREMTVRLGDFLRMTLENAGAQEVSLEKEIGMIECYLDIEKIRFGNRLTTDIRIAPEVFGCQIPNLLLQPLVENAVKHGIAPQTRDGRIRLTAERENGWLRIGIEDNGQGIENEAEIFTSGVGLSNTKARLEQSFGRNFRFDFDSVEGQGLRVTLRLPADGTNKFYDNGNE